VTASALPPFRLVGRGRAAALDAVANAPDGWWVRLSPPKRSLDQNAALHGYCAQIAKAKPEWNGMAMDADDWKNLLVCSHAVATRGESIRLVPSLEGNGLVQLVERTSRMSKERASSLLSYIAAWAAGQGITLVGGDYE
jgi:hypothetical protein